MKNKDLTDYIHKILKLRLKSRDYIKEIKIKKSLNLLKNDFDYNILFLIELTHDDGLINKINKSVSVTEIKHLLNSVLNINENNIFVLNNFID